MAENSDIVTFLDHEGNVISNDPRWIAEQTVRRFEDTAENPEGGVTEQGVETEGYAGREAEWLKEEVKRRRDAGREIDTKGVKRKSQLVKLLEADDEAQEIEAGSSSSDVNPNGAPAEEPNADEE